MTGQRISGGSRRAPQRCPTAQDVIHTALNGVTDSPSLARLYFGSRAAAGAIHRAPFLAAGRGVPLEPLKSSFVGAVTAMLPLAMVQLPPRELGGMALKPLYPWWPDAPW